MKFELLDSCFRRGWKCFSFDLGATFVILDSDNYCIQINKNHFDPEFLKRLATASLKSLASEFKQ